MNCHQKIITSKQKIQQKISKGRYAEAVSLLHKTLKSSPTDAEAQYMLGCCQANLGNWNQAIKALQSSIQIQPTVAQSHFALSGVYIALGKQIEAIKSLEAVLQIDEKTPDAHIALASIQLKQGGIVDARKHLERALEINPKASEAYLGLGKIEQEAGDYKKAMPYFEKALKHNSKNIDALCGVAATLANQSRMKEARNFYRKALHIDPENLEAVSALAMIYNFSGDYDKSMDLIQPMLQKKIYYSTLSVTFLQACKHVNRCPEAIDFVNEALKQPNIPKPAIKNMHFSAAEVLDKMQQYDAAFMHYKKGNEVMGSLYDTVAHAQQINNIIEVFTPALFSKVPRAHNENKRPVFIIGMPRSGTSLTEQILAAHPKVYAAGELDILSLITQQTKIKLGGKEEFPFFINKLDQGNVNQMAKQYLDRLIGLSKQAERVTDKMPHNFYMLGLIQLLFPGARVIHCRREPMDTCLSIYFQNFNEVHKFAKDLFNIGTHYHQYQRLMEHWSRVLTVPILDVHYEELVSNQESVTRRILEFCELDWDDKCLQFHNLKRKVDTASYDQVRQPLYTKSIARWRNYEPFLDDLKAGLQRAY